MEGDTLKMSCFVRSFSSSMRRLDPKIILFSIHNNNVRYHREFKLNISNILIFEKFRENIIFTYYDVLIRLMTGHQTIIIQHQIKKE